MIDSCAYPNGAPTASITGGTFTIRARNNSPENVYIQRAALNGKTLLTADVNGTRSVSLKKIPNGKYITKVTSANGKLLLKKSIAIK